MLSNFRGLLWVLTGPKGGNDRGSREDLAEVEIPLGLSLLRYIYQFSNFRNLNYSSQHYTCHAFLNSPETFSVRVLFLVWSWDNLCHSWHLPGGTVWDEFYHYYSWPTTIVLSYWRNIDNWNSHYSTPWIFLFSLSAKWYSCKSVLFWFSCSLLGQITEARQER